MTERCNDKKPMFSAALTQMGDMHFDLTVEISLQ